MSKLNFAAIPDFDVFPVAAIAGSKVQALAIGKAYDRTVIPTIAALDAAQTQGLQGKVADNGGVDKDALAKNGDELHIA